MSAATGDLNLELQGQLKALQQELRAATPPEVAAAMEQATADMVRTGIADRALKPGDQAPDFSLPNAVGAPITLRDKLAIGPVVVTFYRGAW